MSETADMRALERRLGYRFDDRRLLEEALTHRSWAYEQGVDRHYERIEFLGDAVLDLLVAHWLYDRYADWSEGELSRMKSFLVSEPVLARWAEHLELGRALRLGIGEERTGGRTKRSLLADVLEAVLGAVFLDGGLDAARRIAYRWLSESAGAELEEVDVTDAKTALQEAAQARGMELPVYRHTREEGPDHSKSFHVECWLGDRLIGTGVGASKKRAEQIAAREALSAFDAALPTTEESD